MDADALHAAIRSAFRRVEPPPECALARSREGEEPVALERAFADAPAWDSLSPVELDAAPEGWATALSFFSDEAFRDDHAGTGGSGSPTRSGSPSRARRARRRSS